MPLITTYNQAIRALLLSISVMCIGCAEDDMLDRAKGTPAVFTTDLHAAATRVTDTGWSSTDQIGVYMVNQTGGTLTAAAGELYKPGTGSSLTAVGTPLYYPVDGTTVKFIAFAPHAGSKPTSTTVEYDMSKQNTGTDAEKKTAMEALDFVYCNTKTAANTNERYYSKSKPNAKLTFNHKLCKVIIKVKQGAGVSTAMSSVNIEVGSVPLKASCNLATGTATGTGTTTLKPRRSVSATASTEFECIMAPHTATGNYAGRLVKFTIGSMTYTHSLPQAYVAGNKYIYDFTLTQSGVTLSETSVIGWGDGDVSWSGNYNLSVSERTLSLTKPASAGTITFKTNNTATPSIEFRVGTSSSSAKATWMTFERKTEGKEGNYTTYSLNYSAEQNGGSTPREGYIHIMVENMTVLVHVTQSPTIYPVTQGVESNCYILPPNGHILDIPVSRIKTFAKVVNDAGIPFENRSTYENFNIGDSFSAAVLWSERESGIIASVTALPESGFIRVQSGGTSGNAVIALWQGTTILWSWHIWVTGYDPELQSTYLNEGGNISVFMDRNLGAITSDVNNKGSIGLLYQQGRKDPFPGTRNAWYTAAEPTVWYRSTAQGALTAVANYGTSSHVIQNASMPYTNSVGIPFTFLGTKEGSIEWCSTTTKTYDRLRWSGKRPDKAIDDPCPPGWHVPNAFSSDKEYNPTYTKSYYSPNGCNVGTFGYVPNSGYRQRNGQIYACVNNTDSGFIFNTILYAGAVATDYNNDFIGAVREFYNWFITGIIPIRPEHSVAAGSIRCQKQ